MTGKTTHFRTEDFNKQGEFDRFHSKCKLNNSVFVKGDTLKHQEIQQVLETCNKYNSFGFDTLIIQGELDLTIWIEQVSQSKAKSAVTKNISTREAQVSSSTQVSLPTKTITKRYRGQIYEETVIDWAAVAVPKQELPKEDKLRRKYRGNYID